MISMLLALSFVGSCAAGPLAARLGPRTAGWVVALLPAGLFAGFLRLSTTIAAGQTVTERLAWAPSLAVQLTWRLDGFAYLFCLLVTGIGTLVVIYAGAYLAERTAVARARFLVLILLFMTAMLGAVLADDLLVLFVFWELTSLFSFLLIGFDVHSPSARRSALMSLRVTAGGGLALLAAILLIGIALGSYSLTEVVARAPELAASPWILPILAGVLIGAFTKSAQFPFHFWLPNAMQAPTPASAYLHSATMVKLGIYLLARFEPVIGAVPGGRDLLIAVALATMLVGIVPGRPCGELQGSTRVLHRGVTGHPRDARRTRRSDGERRDRRFPSRPRALQGDAVLLRRDRSPRYRAHPAAPHGRPPALPPGDRGGLDARQPVNGRPAAVPGIHIQGISVRSPDPELVERRAGGRRGAGERRDRRRCGGGHAAAVFHERGASPGGPAP
jgi:hypothetical protein